MRHKIEKPTFIKKVVVRSQNTFLILITLIKIVIKNGLRASLLWIKQKKAFTSRQWSNYKELCIENIDKYIINKNTIKQKFETLGISSISELQYEKINQHSKTINDALLSLSINELLNIYQYYRYYGSFKTSYYFRYLLLQKHVYKQSIKKILLNESVNALLEMNNPEMALQILYDKKRIRVRSVYYQEALAMSHYLTGDKTLAHNILMSIQMKFPIKYCKVLIRKPNAPINGILDTVEVEVCNNV